MIITGIGSRSITKDREAALLFHKLFAYLSRRCGEDGSPILLRSGGSDGSDMIAERAFKGKKEIFLPWNGFNGEHDGAIVYEKDKEAEAIVNRLHPAPERLSQGARKCLERDVWQIIGTPDYRKDSDVVICWTPDAKITGGTAMAIRVAKEKGIPVYNIASAEERKKLKEEVLSKLPPIPFGL